MLHSAEHHGGQAGFVPPGVEPPDHPLGLLESLRAARRNVLEILPGLSFVQPIVSARTGPGTGTWCKYPGALKRIFLDNAANYPKSEVMLRMLRPAVGASLFASEGDAWRWQRRAIAPVFSARNVAALAPVMRATAERAAARIAATRGPVEVVREMLSATFDVICEVALAGREHFDAEAYGEAITRYFLTVGRASLLDFLDAPHWVPRPGTILGRGAVRRMHRMVAEAIAAHPSARRAGRRTCSTTCWRRRTRRPAGAWGRRTCCTTCSSSLWPATRPRRWRSPGR